MTIVLIIAIVATVACMVMLTYRIGIIEKKTDTAIKMADNTDTAIQVKNLDVYTKNSVGVANVNFDSVANAIKQQRTDIDSIISQLETITTDIGRLDGEVAQVKKDEREIRAYYVNFRQPKALPVYNTGVEWAKDQKCFDDMSNEEKIEELSKRADTYLDLMGKGGTADMVKYTNEYNKCVKEIQKLLGEKDNA